MGGIQHSTLLLAEYLILKERYEIELLLPNSGPLSRILSNKSIPIKVYNSIKYKSTAISFLNDQFRIPNPFSWCWNFVAIGLNIIRIRENINPNTDLVVSKGLLNHFTSVIASKLLKIPVLIHLQDLITGRYLKEIINICPGVDVFNPTHLNEIVNIMEKYEDPDSRNRHGKLNKASGRKHFDISIHGKKMEQIIQNVYRSSL